MSYTTPRGGQVGIRAVEKSYQRRASGGDTRRSNFIAPKSAIWRASVGSTVAVRREPRSTTRNKPGPFAKSRSPFQSQSAQSVPSMGDSVRLRSSVTE